MVGSVASKHDALPNHRYSLDSYADYGNILSHQELCVAHTGGLTSAKGVGIFLSEKSHLSLQGVAVRPSTIYIVKLRSMDWFLCTSMHLTLKSRVRRENRLITASLDSYVLGGQQNWNLSKIALHMLIQRYFRDIIFSHFTKLPAMPRKLSRISRNIQLFPRKFHVFRKTFQVNSQEPHGGSFTKSLL